MTSGIAVPTRIRYDMDQVDAPVILTPTYIRAQSNYLTNTPGLVEPTEEDVYLSMDMFSYFLVCYMRYPTVDNDSIFPTLSYRTEGQTFDYFFSSGMAGGAGDMGLFGWSGGGRVRHMLSADPEVPLLAALRCEGKMGWIRGNPYLVLLEHYLDCFLPISGTTAVRTPGMDGDSGVFEGGAEGLSRKGELFLRLAIDFWIDTAPVVRFSYDKVSYFKDVLSQRSFRTTATTSSGSGLSSKGMGGAAESAANRLERLGAGGGSLSASSASKDTGMPAISYDEYSALTDSRRGTHSSSNQQQLSTDLINDSMRNIPIPTYDAWCTSTSATSAMPVGGAVPFIKPPSCTEVLLLSTSLAPVPTKSTLQCVYLLVSHVLTGVSVDHFRQLGPGASAMRWGQGGSDMGGNAAASLPLPSAVQLLQQPVFDLLRSLMSR
jgi:hypothetical protein